MAFPSTSNGNGNDHGYMALARRRDTAIRLQQKFAQARDDEARFTKDQLQQRQVRAILWGHETELPY